MIRRGFWLVAGAAIGVAGYRKATRLARTLAGQPNVQRLTQGSRASVAPWPVRLGAGARSAAAFAHDVRAGMAEYRAEHAGPESVGYRAGRTGPDPVGGGSDPVGGGSDPVGGDAPRGAPGPANNRVLHGGQIGRSLGSRSPESLGGQAQPGAGQRGPREH
jgi:hypothetical protein